MTLFLSACNEGGDVVGDEFFYHKAIINTNTQRISKNFDNNK